MLRSGSFTRIPGNAVGCFVGIVLLIVFSGCSSQPQMETLTVLGGLVEAEPSAGESASPARPEQSGVLLTVDGIALVQLEANGFAELSLQEKLLAYHLYRVAVAGRDIAFDQKHRHALTIRYLLDGILSHPLGLKPEVEEELFHYASLFWLNNGPYNERTKTRFPAPFTRAGLLEALGIASANGADFSVLGRPLEEVVLDLEPLFWDPTFEPLMTNKNPGPDGDMLRESANNFYHDVSVKDLSGFEEKYPLNSRLARVCPRRKPCHLEEQVYRTGKKDDKGRKWVVEPGLCARELANVNAALQQSLSFSSGHQRQYLEDLVSYFETGDPATFDEASIAWLQSNPPVDIILGFIETYKDARGRKGEWEALVYYVDRTTTKMMQDIAQNAAYFEDKAPWAEKYKNKERKAPVASAINVLIGVGGAGPYIPLGINLPNAQWIREKHGSRSVLLSNVMTAAKSAVAELSLKAFALPEELPAIRKYKHQADRAMVALHEIIGHGSGKVDTALEKDPSEILGEHYSTLEEARADLVALHSIFDSKLIELGVLESKDAASVAYADYIRYDLVQLRRVKQGKRFEDDHMRAHHLISQYILANGEAAKVRKIDGKTYYTLVDIEAARAAVATLLAEIMRIKATGDRSAARSLVEQYALEFVPELRDEVVGRAKAAGIPDFIAFHVPNLKLVRSPEGEVTDVIPDYSKDFLGTMLEWDLTERP